MSAELKQCPFCGGEPELIEIGNNWTKKRSVTVKCPTCRIQLTYAGILRSIDWLTDTAVNGWNRRVI